MWLKISTRNYDKFLHIVQIPEKIMQKISIALVFRKVEQNFTFMNTPRWCRSLFGSQIHVTQQRPTAVLLLCIDYFFNSSRYIREIHFKHNQMA